MSAPRSTPQAILKSKPPVSGALPAAAPPGARKAGSAGCRGALEVFAVFLRLGLTSFGGPLAHLGHFHRELVARRGWVPEEEYAQLLALAQLLPGPASSQLGMALGLRRAGWPGALAAFAGFTAPSALLMAGFAWLLPSLSEPWAQGALHGLALLAVAVIAQGLLGMARRLTPDMPRGLIAASVGAAVTLFPSAGAQLWAIALGAVLGLWLCRDTAPAASATAALSGPSSGAAGPRGVRAGCLCIGLYVLLLAASAVAPHILHAPLVAAASAFYRSGALVFGGGHVVLPLLQQSVVAPGWVSSADFLAGYGAAQGLPGPLFTIAAFLGARLALPGGAAGLPGAAIALGAIFLPGLLLMAGSLPLWQRLARHRQAAGALAGVNAAVVGLLAAALYNPAWLAAVRSAADFAVALVAFVVLVFRPGAVLAVLCGCVAAAVYAAVR